MKKGFLVCLLSALCMTAFAQLQNAPEWNSILSDQPETFRTQLVSSSEGSIKVNVQVPGFYTTNVTTPRGEAKIVSMPKAISTAQAGEPNLPMTGIPAIIGDHARMSVRIVFAQYRDFENIEVAPSKGDFSRQIDPTTVPYTYGECYNQDTFFPANNVGLYEPYIIRDFRGQNMVVYPFAYNPVTKTLRVYYDMTIEMYKVDDNGENVMEARKSNTVKMDADFKNMYQRHFINYEAGMAKYTPVDEEGDLLIICYDGFLSSMTDFVNWKKTRGVNTTIVGTSTVGSTDSAIKTYIQNQYNANNNLTHVLLVGDVAQIPGYSYTGGGSSYGGLGDNPYGQIVGNDIYNDLFIGRFSAQTAAQVTTQVNRTITYERDLTTSATWLQNGDGISKQEGGSGHNGEDDYQHIDHIRTDLLNFGYNTVYQDYSNLSGYTGTATSISNHINSGVGIVNYCNHGNNQMWGVASYSNTQVNNLTNSNKLPFIWSVACLVGKYDNTSTSYGGNYTIGQSNDCFAEAWMHATYSSSDLTPTGAVGALMSYISQPWVPPMWAQDECIDILVESYNNNIKHTWGGTSINGILGIFDHYSTSEISAVGTYQAWILYGDPTMMLRTKTPQAMTVTHPGSINLAATTYTVNVTNGNGALATITDANHNILGSATVSNGSANITLTAPNQIQDLTLCVFGYNKVTYLGSISVVDGAQYNITCNQPEHGSISAPEMAYGFQTVTLTATPETGYCLSSWEVRDANNNLIPVTNNTFVMPESNVMVSATFVEGMKVTLASVMNGTITADPVFALQGTTINLTATPETGYVFNSWIVYKTGDVNTTVAVSDNSFTMPDYDVTVSGIFLVPQGGEVNVGSGSNTSAYLPSNVWYKYSTTQQIYTAAEVGDAGTITAVSFKYNGNSTSGARTIDIYMSHATSSTITSWVAEASSHLVYSGTQTFVNNDWYTFTLNTPFEYDGNNNILITFDDNTGSYSGSSGRAFYTYSTGESRSIYQYNDNYNQTPLNPQTGGSYNAYTSTSNCQIIFTKEIPSTDGYLSVSPDVLSDFTYAEGEGPSEVQSVALIGVNLQGNVTVAMPTGYEVSNNGSTYASTLNLTPANGNLQQMLYVRLSADLTQGNYNGTMTLTSGTSTQSITLSGEVTEGSGSGNNEQTFQFAAGLNWWTANVGITLAQLEAALGSNGIMISNKEGQYASYNPTYGWGGSLTTIEAGKMYKIQTNTACEITLTGPAVNPADVTITLNPGNNWIGFVGTQSMSVTNALANLTPTVGDVISAANGTYATYTVYGWGGSLQILQPGNGYIYNSKAAGETSFTFPSAQ